ncbi:MAG: flagellar motor switch protein FliM [Firmicutes bacterium]|nr:flagellar motor switch protein FliM [Bacillota bacterium]
MADVLSQAEIDRLLSQLRQPAALAPELSDQGPIQRYDFRGSYHFDREQVRAFTVMVERFRRALETQLAMLTRIACRAVDFSIEALPVTEYIRAQPQPAAIGLCRTEHGGEPLWISLIPSLAFALVDRTLGGPEEMPAVVHGLTEIDRVLVEQLMRQVGSVLARAASESSGESLAFEGLETNPLYLDISSVEGPALVASATLTAGKANGILSLCLPQEAVKDLFGLPAEIAAQHATPLRPLPQAEKAPFVTRLEAAPVELRVQLGQTTLHLNEIAQLAPGTYLRLQEQADQPMLLLVNGTPKFEVTVGQHDGRYAVQILKELAP